MNTNRYKWLRYLAKKEDRLRIDAIKVPNGAPLPVNIERLLWVSNEFFTAGAVWKRISGAWSCVKAAPILRWMVGMNCNQAKLELLRKGCHYEWLASSQSITKAEKPHLCMEPDNDQRSVRDSHKQAA